MTKPNDVYKKHDPAVYNTTVRPFIYMCLKCPRETCCDFKHLLLDQFTPDTKLQTKVEKSRLSRSGASSETKDRLRLWFRVIPTSIRTRFWLENVGEFVTSNRKPHSAKIWSQWNFSIKQMKCQSDVYVRWVISGHFSLRRVIWLQNWLWIICLINKWFQLDERFFFLETLLVTLYNRRTLRNIS